MIIAVPADTPVTSPVAVPVPAADAPLVLVHVPPAVKSLTETDDPIQTPLAPPIPEGFAFTVTTMVDDTPDTV